MSSLFWDLICFVCKITPALTPRAIGGLTEMPYVDDLFGRPMEMSGSVATCIISVCRFN